MTLNFKEFLKWSSVTCPIRSCHSDRNAHPWIGWVSHDDFCQACCGLN